MSREVIIKVLDREEIDAHARKSFYIDEETHEAKVELLAPYQNMGELIRCKDCEHYARNKNIFHRGADCLKGNLRTIVPDIDFCSKAERKEE